MPELVWEILNSNVEETFSEASKTTLAYLNIYRAAVPGGWLVTAGGHSGITFLPDRNHLWDGGSIEPDEETDDD